MFLKSAKLVPSDNSIIWRGATSTASTAKAVPLFQQWYGQPLSVVNTVFKKLNKILG